MKLYKYFLLLTRAKQIATVVLALHFGLICTLVIHHLASRRLKPLKPIVVKTLAAPTPKVLVQPSQKIKQRPNKKTAAPSIKKPSAKKGPMPRAKPTPKRLATPISKNQVNPKALKQLSKSLDAIKTDAKSAKKELSLPTPVTPQTVKPVEEISYTDASYAEYLVAFLQNALELPEYGSVRIKIWIDRFGKLIDCEILEAKSEKNAQTLKNQLPDLTFPCLQDFNISKSSQDFTITFENAEIH